MSSLFISYLMKVDYISIFSECIFINIDSIYLLVSLSACKFKWLLVTWVEIIFLCITDQLLLVFCFGFNHVIKFYSVFFLIRKNVLVVLHKKVTCVLLWLFCFIAGKFEDFKNFFETLYQFVYLQGTYVKPHVRVHPFLEFIVEI